MKLDKLKHLNKKQTIGYLLVVFFSVIYIIVGHDLAMTNYENFNGEDESIVAKATVLEILDRYSDSYQISETEYAKNETIVFKAKFTSGDMKGLEIEAAQTLDYFTAVNLRVVEPGDKVLLYSYPGQMSDNQWLLSDYERFNQISVLLVLFLLLLLFFGGVQGFNTIISLSLTCLAVLYVFVPAVLAGENIYSWSIVTCIYVTFMTLFVVNGINKKSFAAIFGCLAGLAFAGFLTLFMDHSMILTGVLNEDSVILHSLRPENPIDLQALIFAGIIIGAMGAVMDVSISIAASLAELKEKLPNITFKELWKSGMTISRDIMGTMANTLILAYIGSFLCSVLLMVAYNSSMLDLFNRESIIVELLQTLVGSLGILLTLPMTALICAALYHGDDKKHSLQKHSIELEASQPNEVLADIEPQ